MRCRYNRTHTHTKNTSVIRNSLLRISISLIPKSISCRVSPHVRNCVRWIDAHDDDDTASVEDIFFTVCGMETMRWMYMYVHMCTAGEQRTWLVFRRSLLIAPCLATFQLRHLFGGQVQLCYDDDGDLLCVDLRSWSSRVILRSERENIMCFFFCVRPVFKWRHSNQAHSFPMIVAKYFAHLWQLITYDSILWYFGNIGFDWGAYMRKYALLIWDRVLWCVWADLCYKFLMNGFTRIYRIILPKPSGCTFSLMFCKFETYGLCIVFFNG